MSCSYFLYGSIFEKCGYFWKNTRFFPGGYGRIGVYRVKDIIIIVTDFFLKTNQHSWFLMPLQQETAWAESQKAGPCKRKMSIFKSLNSDDFGLWACLNTKRYYNLSLIRMPRFINLTPLLCLYTHH